MFSGQPSTVPGFSLNQAKGVVSSFLFFPFSRLNAFLQVLSYYKIFGYPTGLGALLVHKRALPLLLNKKRYFGGGTVAVSLAEEDFFRSAAVGIHIHIYVYLNPGYIGFR